MRNILIGFLLLVLTGSTQVSAIPAFPGAEGFGANSIGGRGGIILKVTNLDDSGPGSLRAAVAINTPRIIVFEVSGNIFLESRLSINKPYITIAGQTAPGDGIALVGEQVSVKTHDVIIRYLRFRAGDMAGKELDALNDESDNYDTIVDHCTASWGIDETLSFYIGHDFTVQWCIISESLYDSIHSKGPHGYGGIWGGTTNATFHHNLLAHHSSRNPRFGDGSAVIDHRNNVIYNWGFNSAYGGEDSNSNMNIVNNYYKYGPATNSSVKRRIFQCSDVNDKAYINGNYVYGAAPTTADNWFGGIDYENGASMSTLRVYEPFAAADVNTTSAEQAFIDVLAHAGVSYPSRDFIDTRIISEVNDGNATYGATWGGGGKGIIDSQYDLCPDSNCPNCPNNCWLPVLNSTTPPNDTDNDGMPDYWEQALCLNPNDPNDSSGDRDGDGYTNIEEYINWLPLGEPMPTNTNLNCDNTVDFRDFSEFAGHCFTSSDLPLYDEKYDFDDDDVISIYDLLYIIDDWLWTITP